MKKFLPLIIFVLVFCGVLVWQIGSNMWKGDPRGGESSQYQEFENLFLHAQYQTWDQKKLVMAQIKAPLVIVNFWASWCMPCLDEIPSMMKLKKNVGPNQLEIVAINTDYDDPQKNIAKIKKQLGIGEEFSIVADVDGKISEQFKINAIPVSIVYFHGKVVHFSNGPMDFYSEEFRKKIEQWLK